LGFSPAAGPERELKIMMTERTTNFDDFMQATKKRVYAFALRLTRNRDDAEDLLQDAIIRAYRAYDPDGERKPSEAWLKQIVFNCFVDSRRRANRRPQTLSLNILQEQNQHFDAEDSAPTIDQELSNIALSESVCAALNQLTDDQRNLILTVLYQDASYADLAESFGCRPQTLKTRLHRAHQSLKRHLLLIDPAYAQRNRPTFA
jgi:RNA polymerase sigma-70 factor (ECF subfamily)